MGYGIKYTTLNLNNTLRKGNISTTSAHSADPSQNFHSGIPLEDGKHTVVQVHSSNDPDFWSLDDSDFIRLVRSMGSTAITIVEAKNYIKNQSDLFYIDDISFNNSVNSSLTLDLNSRYNESFVDNEPTTNLITNTSTMYFSGNSDGQWNYQTVAGSGSISTENPRFGSYSAKLTRAGSGGEVNYWWNAGGSLSLTPGETYTFSMLVWCDQPGMAKLFSYLAGTNGSSDFHPGDSQWHQLSMQFSPAASTSAAQIRFGLQSNNSNYPVTAYFDCAQVEAGSIATSFTENTRTQNNTWYDLSGNGNNTSISSADYNSEGKYFQSVGNAPDSLIFSTPDSTTINDTFSVTSGGWTIEELIRIDDTTYPEAAAGTVVSTKAYGSTNTGFDWNHGVMSGTSLNIDMSNKNTGGGASRDAEVNLAIDPEFQTYGQWLLRSIYWDRTNDKCGVYYNGVFQDSGSISGISGYSLYDGGGISWGTLYGWHHDGARSFMRVYNKVLSETEVLQNYYGGSIVTDGLVLALDAGNLISYESGSTTAYSMTGSLSGSLLNGTGYSSNNGGTFVFDGSDDNLRVDTQGVLGTFQDWSMDAWIKWSDDGYTSWMIVADQTTYSKYYKNIMVWLSSASSNKKIAMYDGSWKYGTISIPSNTWTHIAATTEGQVAKMYVNGQFDVSRTFGWNITTDVTEHLGIGGQGTNPSYRMNGNIAITRIYNRTLTAEEVQQNYIAHKARFPS